VRALGVTAAERQAVLPDVSAVAPEPDVVSVPVLAPQALRAADAPAADMPARRPRLLMLSPDMHNLLAPKGEAKRAEWLERAVGGRERDTLQKRRRRRTGSPAVPG